MASGTQSGEPSPLASKKQTPGIGWLLQRSSVSLHVSVVHMRESSQLRGAPTQRGPPPTVVHVSPVVQNNPSSHAPVAGDQAVRSRTGSQT